MVHDKAVDKGTGFFGPSSEQDGPILLHFALVITISIGWGSALARKTPATLDCLFAGRCNARSACCNARDVAKWTPWHAHVPLSFMHSTLLFYLLSLDSERLLKTQSFTEFSPS